MLAKLKFKKCYEKDIFDLQDKLHATLYHEVYKIIFEIKNLFLEISQLRLIKMPIVGARYCFEKKFV